MAKKLLIYICLDSSISYRLDFVRCNFKRGYYTYFKQENYDVLVVWRRDYIFIAYIVELAKREIDFFLLNLILCIYHIMMLN